MLLPFRWLLYGTAAASTGATRKHPKIQRKLRRLARWTEAIAPPRISIIVEGRSAILSLTPEIRTGEVITTKHVAVYSKGLLAAGISVAPFLGVDVSITPHSAFRIPHSIKTGEIETKIDLLEDEMLALALLLA